MQFLGYPDWLLMVNYAVARVPRVVAKVSGVVVSVHWVVSKALLCGC